MADDDAPQNRTFAGGWDKDIGQFLGQNPDDHTAGMAAKVQDYLTLKAHTNAAAAADQQYTQGFAAAKGNLVKMVQGDPLSTDLALSLAPDIVHSFTSHHEDEDERAQAHGELTGHIQNAVAHAAIQTMAERSPDAARAGLEKYDQHLTDGDRAGLSSYIDNQADLQRIDNLAGHVQMAKQMVSQNHALTGNYLSGLVDDNGAIRFPPGWGQKMMGDAGLAPESKASLHGAYSRLVSNGDLTQSDPNVLTSLLNRLAAAPHDPDHPMANDIIDLVGNRPAPTLSTHDPRAVQDYNTYQSITSGDQVLDAQGNNAALASKMDRAQGMANDRDPAYRARATDPGGDPVIKGRQAFPNYGNEPNIVGYDWTKGPANGLTMGDAQHLISMVGPQGPQQRQNTQDLAGAMQDAKDVIGNDRAFGRFADWFMPAVRNAQASGAPMQEILDPEKGLLARLGDFLPNGDDIVQPAVAAFEGARRSLGDIFGAAGSALSDVGRAGVRASNDFLSGSYTPAQKMIVDTQQLATGVGLAPGVAGSLGANLPILAGTTERLLNQDFGPAELKTPEGKTYNPDTDA